MIANVLAAAGLSFTEAKYYDFRYPNATKMMIVIERGNYESFLLKLPSSFSYFERSGFTSCYFTLNGTQLLDNCYQSNYLTLQAAQLSPEQFHTIEVYGTGGLLLIYKES